MRLGRLAWLRREVALVDGGWIVGGEAIPTSDGSEDAITEALYLRCYARPRKEPPEFYDSSRFLADLRSVHASADRYQRGWHVEQVREDGSVTVVRAGLRRRLPAGRYLVPRFRGVRVGDEVVAFTPGDDAASDAYLHVSGGPDQDASELGNDVRFYFNVAAQGAPALLGWITGRLNAFSIPFHFKCLLNPAAYRRADAAVLYVAARYFQIVHQLCRDALQDGLLSLHSAVPRLTKRLFPGVGFAEDPPSGESFGMNRCRLLAGALVQNREIGADFNWSRLAETVGAAGLDSRRPYLNPGSVDIYEPQYQCRTTGARRSDEVV